MKKKTKITNREPLQIVISVNKLSRRTQRQTGRVGTACMPTWHLKLMWLQSWECQWTIEPSTHLTLFSFFFSFLFLPPRPLLFYWPPQSTQMCWSAGCSGGSAAVLCERYSRLFLFGPFLYTLLTFSFFLPPPLQPNRFFARFLVRPHFGIATICLSIKSAAMKRNLRRKSEINHD